MLEKRGMINKKAQVTLFIIIAIVIVAIVLIGFVYRDKIFITTQKIRPEVVAPVQQLVQACLNVAANDALISVGFQGGYVEPMTYLKTNLSEISYWYYNGEDKRPSIENIENELSKYVDLALPLCLRFNPLKDYNLDYNESNTTVLIKNNTVIFNSNFPISIKKNDLVVDLSDFKETIKINLMNIMI